MSDAPPSLRQRVASIAPPVSLPTRVLAVGALAALAFVSVQVPGALPLGAYPPIAAFLLAIIAGRSPTQLAAPETPRETPEARRKA